MICRFPRDTTLTFVNDACCAVFSRRRNELQSQKNHLDYIIQGIDAGTWEWNVQTGQTVYSEHRAEIIGYSLDELQPVDSTTWTGDGKPLRIFGTHVDISEGIRNREQLPTSGSHA